jgi:hypothetical protein
MAKTHIFIYFSSLFKKINIDLGFNGAQWRTTAMALNDAPLLCLFIIVSDIFMFEKDTPKTHSNNTGHNVPDNAPLAIYPALANHGPQDR